MYVEYHHINMDRSPFTEIKKHMKTTLEGKTSNLNRQRSKETGRVEQETSTTTKTTGEGRTKIRVLEYGV